MAPESQIDKRKDDEISLKELIVKIQQWARFLLSKWLMMFLIGILGGVFGYIYAFTKSPVYTASTTFVLEEDKQSGGMGSLAGLASIAGVEIGGAGGIFQGDNILMLYKSRTMVEKALLTEVNYNGERQLLLDRYIKVNKLREKWDLKNNLKGIQFRNFNSFSRTQDSLLGKIVNDINTNYLSVAKPDKKLSIIRADVKSTDEFFAKTFNEEIVKNVNDFYVQTKTKKSLENVRILAQKTDSVRAVMNGAIYSAAAVSDATPNLNPTRQVQRAAPVQRSQFSAETNKAILSSLVQNLEMSKIALRKEAPLIQVIDRPVFPLEISSLGKVKAAVIGSFVFIMITIIVVSIKRIFKSIMA